MTFHNYAHQIVDDSARQGAVSAQDSANKAIKLILEMTEVMNNLVDRINLLEKRSAAAIKAAKQ